MTAPSIQSRPLPVDLSLDLPTQSGCPWEISARVFGDMQTQPANALYKKTQILSTDPEWRFVWRYFYANKPLRYGIKKIHCIFERHQQQAFELNLSSQEREADTFPPTWDQEPRADERKEAIDRWKESAQIFSPFQTKESDGRIRTWTKTKVLPLWHGTAEAVSDSICKSGFTFFGKTSMGGAKAQSTDAGFFGSGIYFTDSARYAGDIYSKGHLLLSWVSMREPFPVVGDPQQQDMSTLRGQGAYKTYNSHYIPVVSKNPQDPNEPNYYPTMPGTLPQWDEYVIFNKSQALPRFWVELQLETPYMMNPSNIPQFVAEMIPHFMKLLENPNVDRDLKLRNLITKELAVLMKLQEDDDLEDKYEELYKQLTQLIDSAGCINKAIRNLLTKVNAPQDKALPALGSPAAQVASAERQVPSQPAQAIPFLPAPPFQNPNEVSPPQSKAAQVVSQGAAKAAASAPTPPLSTMIPMAFGAEKWKKYFGDVGIEPPLPPNILEILSSPCPYWSGKTVAQTHMLTLIPATLNGSPYTLNLLGQIIKTPQGEGHTAKYCSEDTTTLKERGGAPNGAATWSLITKDVLPGSRNNSYNDQTALLKSEYSTPKALELATAILMHQVQTGERLYSDSPHTYSRCEEKVHNNEWRVVIGSFGASGLYVRNCLDVPSHDSYGLAGARKF